MSAAWRSATLRRVEVSMSSMTLCMVDYGVCRGYNACRSSFFGFLYALKFWMSQCLDDGLNTEGMHIVTVAGVGTW
jgi:hypothetical protein